MILTLVGISITFPYDFLEYVLVIVDDLLFPADFVILDMEEDSEIYLPLGRYVLAIGKALIDADMGELILWFNNEKVVFNVFEDMKHQNENHLFYEFFIVEETVEEASKSKSSLPYDNFLFVR